MASDGERASLIVAACSASILIGAYVSIDGIFEKGFIGAIKDSICLFEGLKKSTIIVCLLGALLFIGFFRSEKINGVINNQGFLIGIVAGTLLFIAFISLNDYKKKNKSVSVH